MLSNMTFLMIFAVFDPSPLTLWIDKLQFLVLIQYIAVYIRLLDSAKLSEYTFVKSAFSL